MLGAVRTNACIMSPGPGLRPDSDTVVTDAKHMSSKWRPVESHPVAGSSVADFVKSGGENYNGVFNNCHLGRRRMMNLK